ncbi:MAG: 4-(cytidine 5'-diphospho)-2-C-methyl-D-erythritol kinase [Rhodopirellula sp.]|nr:4-(cytidine 5'-diphospho)-2-C-methyl-D-erythritol kinase [Rhodopirellula sp.]
MCPVTDPYSKTAHTRPPAKLNLFLELLARRPDGFHDIDTVMIPIDWCDELRLQRIPDNQIDLRVQWLPSLQTVAQRLGVEVGSPAGRNLLEIPSDDSNLVHRALTAFRTAFNITDGFHCQLGKQIPAGAGLGGASSDAASALLCAAHLCNISTDTPLLSELAAEIGSDVPFFLGSGGTEPIDGARATGRGEQINAIELGRKLDCIVIFPAICLSTAEVYAASHVPSQPRDAAALLDLLKEQKTTDLGPAMLNRLTEPAKKIAPQIAEILESLWHDELRTCQLTGSGSACFAISTSSGQAQQVASKLRTRLEPGGFVMATQSTQVPAKIDVS